MNRFISNFFLSLTVLIGIAVFSSCEDRLEYFGGPIPDGISTVDLELSYQAFTPALESRASGTAIKSINTLWLVIYDGDGNFMEKRQITDFEERKDVENSRPDGAVSSETTTGHAKFKLTLRNGYYKIFAVVNHNLADVPDSDIDEIAKLKKLDLTWDETNVGANAQMFGHFVNGDKTTTYEGNETVAIRDNSSSLHSWVRRAASKLTIAFNTTNLNENIYIYLKSIEVKDIPKHCYLNDENNVAQDGYELESKLVQGEILYFGQAKATDKGKEDHGKWPVIACGDSVYGLYSDRMGKVDHTQGMKVNDRLAREHAEAAEALYFYENMQPDGIEGTVSDKRQDVSGNNILVSYPNGTYDGSHNGDGSLKDDAYGEEIGWKDGKKWGSYIEVKAYYINNGGAHPGKGDIVYRFMLGKDTKINYEAERNHHYRLTMKFNGNANDVDFHIDYKEEAKPGLYTPDTTYVSYLYNQPATMPMRATPVPGYDFVSFEAVIIENEWIPYPDKPGEDVSGLYNTLAYQMQQAGDASSGYYSMVNKWTTSKSVAETQDKVFYKADPEIVNGTEFGFLSLREVSAVTKNMGGGLHWELIDNFRKAYFKPTKYGSAVERADVSGPLNWREYVEGIPTSDGTITTNDAVDGGYTFTRTTNPNNGEIDYVGAIPLFTRAKTLDTWAVYSGANAFYQHNRKARVKFTAHYKYNASSGEPKTKGDEYSESSYTVVLQAKRIDNPRGIYRRAGNLSPFNVKLYYELLEPSGKQTNKDDDGNDVDEDIVFNEIISRGPWSATIEKDPNGLVQISANGQTVTGENSMVTGRTLTPIQFLYTPQKSPSAGDSYGAIITVRYHGNSCTHKILVRQGYEPIVLGRGTSSGTPVKWSAFNVYNSKELTKSPLSVGSMFRRSTTLDYPISEENNAKYGVGIRVPKNYEFSLSNGKTSTWSNMPTCGAETEAFTSMDLISYSLGMDNGHQKSYRLPTFNEMTQLGVVSDKQTIKNDYANDYNCAYGITYADGASQTLETTAAYTYSDPKNIGKDSRCGMNGVVVYSLSEGENVFFPFGATGHARRKSRIWLIPAAREEDYGYMRYGSLDARLGRDNNSDCYRPMAWDLPSQKGGAYWTNSGTVNGIAIDFNAGNYMTNYLNKDDLYTNPNDGSKPDALPIKPVLK